jgi:RHS repeat-associated protein
VQKQNTEGNKNYFHYAPNDTGAYLTQLRTDIGNDGEDNKDLVTQYRYDSDRGTLDTLIYYHDYPIDTIKVEYHYDLFTRLCKITYPDNTNEEYIYDKRGNLLEKKITKSDATYFKIQYEYDARDHVKKVKEYDNLSTAPSSYDSTLYVYNLNDALTEFSNANDGTTNTTIVYDYVAGRLYRTRYADNNKDSLGYYLSGYVKFKKDRRGKVIEYKYDDRWRLTKKRYFDDWSSYPNSPSDSVSFWLDKVGNLDSLLDKNGKIKYDYDGLDRMFDLNAYNSKMVKYLYDKVSNRTRMKVCKTSDTTVIYLEQTYPSYDEANRLLETIVSPDTFDFTYWDTGPVKESKYPNDLKEQCWLTNRNFIDSLRTYDSSGTGTTLFKFAYGYNDLMDRKSIDLKISRPLISPLTGKISYGYDNLRRLIDSKTLISGIESISYGYDPVGNRDKKKVGTETTRYTYDLQNNHLTYEGSIPYSYDNNGNLTAIAPPIAINYLFDWDYENRLLKIRKTGTFGDSLRFSYCGTGKRITKIHGASDTTKYSYDGMYTVCEFGNYDSLLSAYVYANGLLLARYDSSGAKYYYHHDALGSTMGLTDTNKTFVQSYFYDDFGNLWGEWGNVENHYLYTGQEYDDEISGAELYNLRVRYYDTGIGRFISEDPAIGYIHLPQQRNRYPYVWNMPITLTDPLGLFTGCILLTKYPVKSMKEIISEKEHTYYELMNAYTTGFDEVFPLPFFWIMCDWLQITDITRIYREVVVWSYVLKCWEECKEPYIKAYDVLMHGPLMTEYLRRFRHITTYVKELYDIVSKSPANKWWLEQECMEKAHP